MEDRDEQFIEEINSKQTKAFQVVFNEFYNSLVYFAMQYIGRREIAEDLVQELFMNMWESKTVYASYASFKTFLYTSVRNACLDYLKHIEVEKKYISYSLTHQESEEELKMKITKEEVYRLFLKVTRRIAGAEKDYF